MYLIIGLGNPGDKYTFTRHNTGFLAIDYISQKHGISLNKLKHKSLIGEGAICNKKVILAKPQTFMNLSGESLRELANWYKIDHSKIIVVYDDVSMPLGSLRIREKGSAGGHNGIKSIILNLGTDIFPRFKVGVDPKPAEYDLADYVLSKFMPEEQRIMFETFEHVNQALQEFIKNGPQSAMNKFNMVK